MRAHAVVAASPVLDDDLRLAQRVEDLAIQQLVSKPGIEALDRAVLPGRAWGDVGRLGPNPPQSTAGRLGYELRAIAHQEAGGSPEAVRGPIQSAARCRPAVMASQRVSRVTVFQASFRRRTDHDQAPAYAHPGHSRRDRYQQDPQRGPDRNPRPRSPAALDRAQYPG